MFDSVGVEVKVGDYVSYGGAGNRDCEYGMITGIVIKFSNGNDGLKVSIQRLDTLYNGHSDTKIIFRKQTKSQGKFVKVEPSDKVKLFFERTANNSWTGPDEIKRCSNWIHYGVLT